MERFVSNGSAFYKADTIIKVSESGGTFTVVLNYDTGTDGVDTFTFANTNGTAAEVIERLINEINFSKKAIIDATKV